MRIMCLAKVMPAETEQQRSKRRQQRTLFDGVAQLYDASRPGYPAEIVDFLAATADVGPGSAVLEVGCGTGQLTRDLARIGLDLTAIDIGPAMIATARRALADAPVSLQACSFEDFAAADSSFDLIVSATAFHWIDPEVRFSKAARLLRPGGWLALLATAELYDDPLNAVLREMWVARSEDKAWSARKAPADADAIRASGLFDEPVHRSAQRRTTVPAETVIGVENTRATTLSWPADIREAFTAELRSQLAPDAQVSVTLAAALTMARVR
jgi:ubiquinone/menaquinone biosynthesis C-methylase UbiE